MGPATKKQFRDPRQVDRFKFTDEEAKILSGRCQSQAPVVTSPPDLGGARIDPRPTLGRGRVSPGFIGWSPIDVLLLSSGGGTTEVVGVIINPPQQLPP